MRSVSLVFERGMVGEMVRVEGLPVISCCRIDDRPVRLRRGRRWCRAGQGPGRAGNFDRQRGPPACLPDQKNPPGARKAHNLFRSWDDAFDNFEFDKVAAGNHARPAARLAAGGACDLAGWDIYLAGPQSFVERLGRILGVDTEHGRGRIRLLPIG